MSPICWKQLAAPLGTRCFLDSLGYIEAQMIEKMAAWKVLSLVNQNRSLLTSAQCNGNDSLIHLKIKAHLPSL